MREICEVQYGLRGVVDKGRKALICLQSRAGLLVLGACANRGRKFPMKAGHAFSGALLTIEMISISNGRRKYKSSL